MKNRLYGLGYYQLKLVGQKWVPTGERFQMKLKPMTHTQACVMKSKMSNPANHFLIELN